MFSPTSLSVDTPDTCCKAASHACRAYRLGQKSKLLILSEYVNKTEKIGGETHLTALCPGLPR